MTVRLWNYHLMKSESKSLQDVPVKHITLNIGERGQEGRHAEQAIRYTHQLKELSNLLSDRNPRDSEIDHDDDPDMPAGPPLSEITDITATDPIAILKFSQEALNVWAFPKKRKGITSTEQGARIINVFKGLIVRRSYASTLNGRRLDKDLPSVQRMVFECEYSPQERQHYDAAYADSSSVLFRKSGSVVT
ncbi:uncharacterized protein J4E92_006938 [Alternaria infectoria]|uniref:uncharacterized protein n=1 Tax=Alternaria infectoria TaxID=45303 RepID=UPI0022204F2F|nr:uncharacterized protein J4E92_006938 [Alternaria infectoria]KAI4608991.1 hypothetical protein J4E80_008737 [Alternaria sp. BMP 0032]KAI4924901.1 hypothetical protein J4E92_006938 [Alternaria infectoria]